MIDTDLFAAFELCFLGIRCIALVMTFSIASISIQSDLLIVWLRQMLDETLRAIQFPSYPMTVNLYSTRKHVSTGSGVFALG